MSVSVTMFIYIPSKYIHIPTAGRVGIRRYFYSQFMQICRYMQIQANIAKFILFFLFHRVPLALPVEEDYAGSGEQCLEQAPEQAPAQQVPQLD
jgi:hypothetical protein